MLCFSQQEQTYLPHIIKLENSRGAKHRTIALPLYSCSHLHNIMSFVLNIVERTQNCMTNGFHHECSYGGEDYHSIGVLVLK